jgi:hypothetical protein
LIFNHSTEGDTLGHSAGGTGAVFDFDDAEDDVYVFVVVVVVVVVFVSKILNC